MSLAQYEAAGGYQAFRKALKTDPKEIKKMISDSNLRGRGGAGFYTGQKWAFIPMDSGRLRKYLVVNGDEMEPGTMKDRFLIQGDPHQLIEGIACAAWAVGTEVAFIFLRWAYELCEHRLAKAIAEAREAGYLGRNVLGSGLNLDIRLHISAGRYMCGEEEGLLDALQGKRAIPRSKPPYPAVCGLWGRPTVVNNVETLCNVPHIISRGADWFKSLSRTDEGGTKIYGCSGRVKRPGLWELPLGTPAREILQEHAGGMADGYQFRALLPGGASTAYVLDEHLDTPMDFDSMGNVGSRMGTGTMIVMDDRTCPVGMQLSMQAFFARESCGWCTPCREGTAWVARTLEALEMGDGEPEDLDVLDHHAKLLVGGHTFCALAPGAAMPLAAGLKYFRDDFQRHIDEHCCPWRGT